jgi:hypothetical protein
MLEAAHTLALCCYNDRAVVSNRCGQCRTEYECPEFKTKAGLVQFNAMIPAAMLLSPLPIELWPTMCPDVAADISLQRSCIASASPGSCSASESTDSPVRRLVFALGLPINLDPQST